MDSKAITIGQIVRQFRKARKLTQETLAYESGIKRTHLSHIERGVKHPVIPTLYKLARALDVPGSVILERFERANGLYPNNREKEGWLAFPEPPQKFVDALEDEIRGFISAGDSEATIAYIKLKILEAHLLGMKEGLKKQMRG